MTHHTECEPNRSDGQPTVAPDAAGPETTLAGIERLPERRRDIRRCADIGVSDRRSRDRGTRRVQADRRHGERLAVAEAVAAERRRCARLAIDRSRRAFDKLMYVALGFTARRLEELGADIEHEIVHGLADDAASIFAPAYVPTTIPTTAEPLSPDVAAVEEARAEGSK